MFFSDKLLAETIGTRTVTSYASSALRPLSSVSFEARRSEFFGSEEGKHFSVATLIMAISAHQFIKLRVQERTRRLSMVLGAASSSVSSVR
jgi:hypothetical protein